MPPPASSEDIGRLVDGRYRLQAPLGIGASARVYLAEDTRLGREVAVKMLQPALAADHKFLERFRAEARTVAAFSHPNVVVVHDWGDDGEPFLVTEYLAGGSLRAMIKAGALLSPSQALVVGLDVCRGLAKAHEQGLVHRDLKPANLLFDREGRLRIADFGLARAIAEAAVTEPSGAVIGTARYTAPEQAEGRTLDGKADIYALALCLIEAVTGEHPFPADTTLGTLMARTHGDLDVPRELGALAPALARAGRLDPADRPDAEELGLALLAASEQLTAPRALPLVGALVEAEQAGTSPQESTRTMAMGAVGAAPGTGVDSGEAGETGTSPGALGGATDPSVDAVVAAGSAGVAKRRGWFRRRRTDTTATDVGDRPDTASVVAATTTATGADAGPDGDGGAGGGTRRRWPVVSVAVAVLAALAGGGAYWFTRTPTHDVPDVIGEQIDDLELLAAEYDWELDTSMTRQNGTEPGEIVSTDPPPGTALAEGETLSVLVSAGNELTTVPTEVAGKPLTEVEALFDEAGLDIDATEAFDEDVPADHVIGFVDEPDAELPRGTAVAVTVSKGPAPRTVPPLPSGATFGQYRDALAGVQLQAERVEEFSDTIDEGVVISVGTAPGTEVPRGTAIEVVVSKGPDLVEVPDLAGMSVAEATEALEAAGLELGTTNRDRGSVVVSDPDAGAMVRRGRAVDLLVRGG